MSFSRFWFFFACGTLAIEAANVIWTGFLPPKAFELSKSMEPNALDSMRLESQNLLTCAFEPTTRDQALGSQPRYRYDKDARDHFRSSLHKSLENALQVLEEHSFDPNRPGRNPQYTRIKEALKKIDGMVMTDSIPETDPIREQGRKTTSFEESLRWIQEKLAKYDAADNQDAKSTGLQDPQTMIPHELPKSSPIPRISFPRKPIGESATLKEKIRWLESPSSTETERLKFPSIFKSDDRVAMVKSKQGAYDPPPRPDIERVATSPVDQENNEELAMKLSEKIQRLAQFITSPFSPELQKGALPGTRFRIPIDTPALRVIRSASWDALLYFSYFDLKAEEALVNLYKNPEHTAFLAAMFLTFDIGLHQMILCLQIQWQLRFRFKRACRQ